jgi:hypothetical protein
VVKPQKSKVAEERGCREAAAESLLEEPQEGHAIHARLLFDHLHPRMHGLEPVAQMLKHHRHTTSQAPEAGPPLTGELGAPHLRLPYRRPPRAALSTGIAPPQMPSQTY